MGAAEPTPAVLWEDLKPVLDEEVGRLPEEYRVPCGIHRAMVRADQAWREELRKTTVADLLAGVVADASPEALEKGAGVFRRANEHHQIDIADVYPQLKRRSGKTQSGFRDREIALGGVAHAHVKA